MKAPKLIADLSNPKHMIIPNNPKIRDNIFHLFSLSSKRKWAKIANHRGLVNKIIDDIDEDSPLDIARFKNPIVPVVCKSPMIVTRTSPFAIFPLLLGIISDVPLVKAANINIIRPAIINRQLPIKNGGAWLLEIRYFPVGKDEPINIVVKIILNRNEFLDSDLRLIDTPFSLYKVFIKSYNNKRYKVSNGDIRYLY